MKHKTSCSLNRLIVDTATGRYNAHFNLSPLIINRAIKQGVDAHIVDKLSKIIPFPIICESLDLNGGTLRRRINLGKQLSGKQTDNLFQLVKAWRILVSFFNNNTRLLGMWLQSEVPALDGATPRELLRSNFGRKTLLEVIETMKFGDFA